MPWHRDTAEERTRTLAAVALAESVLKAHRERLEEIEAREREFIRLDALEARVRAQTIRAELDRREAEHPQHNHRRSGDADAG